MSMLGIITGERRRVLNKDIVAFDVKEGVFSEVRSGVTVVVEIDEVGLS